MDLYSSHPRCIEAIIQATKNQAKYYWFIWGGRNLRTVIFMGRLVFFHVPSKSLLKILSLGVKMAPIYPKVNL